MQDKTLHIDSTITQSISPIRTNKYDEVLIKNVTEKIKDLKRNIGLVAVYDATHTGFVNHNNRLYETKSVKSRDYKTFYGPFPKPLVIDHFNDIVPIGRIYDAAWIKVDGGEWHGREMDGVVKTSAFVPKIPGDPYADRIASGNLMTVSSGFYSKSQKCSICGKDWKISDEREECGHSPGSVYDGKKMYLITSGLEYFHLAFATNPAHDFAVMTSMEETGNDNYDHLKDVVKKIYTNKSVYGSELDSVVNQIDIDELDISKPTISDGAVKIYEIDGRPKVYVNSDVKNKQRRNSMDLDQLINDKEAASKLANVLGLDDISNKIAELVKKEKNTDSSSKPNESVDTKDIDTAKAENAALNKKVDELQDAIKKLLDHNEQKDEILKQTIKENILLTAKLVDKKFSEDFVKGLDEKDANKLTVIKEIAFDGKSLDEILKGEADVTTSADVPSGEVNQDTPQKDNRNDDEPEGNQDGKTPLEKIRARAHKK